MIFGNTAEGSQLTPLYTVTLPERATSHIPFTGRRKEEAGIEQFCKTVFSHDTTSVMWISGQAGIGKSYLLRSVSRKIEKSGTIVLHIQFYPFGSSSVLGLLRHLLSVRTDLHSLITEPIQETTSSTISAMRRLIRLRPTLLILEDVHLLQDEGAAELSSLIAAISHEPVAIICAARPIESASYTALLPWITSSMKLSPFSVEEVGELLVGCGIGQAQTIAPHLHRATRGIPLVLRSILLELLQRLREGKLDVTSDNLWEARINERTKAILHSIAPGIASGISPTEQMAFERLSLLGEVFSREAARRLVPEADEIVERGIAAGILAFKRTFHPSLWGQGSTDYPICFVHTLLHESFLARSSGLSISDTLELLESETPLYSTLPIYHIVPQESDTPAESLLPLIRNMCERSRRLLHTTDWILARSILDPVETLYKSMKQAISSEDELLARLTILQGKLFSLRVKFFSDEMRDILQQYLHATEAPATEEIALHRATALSWQARLSFSKPHQSENEGWSPSVIFTETFMLSEKFPRLLGTSHFVALLSTIASSPEKSEEQRQQLRSVLYRVLDETTDLDARLMIYFRLVPYLLLDPTSEEFVEEGINLMEEGEIDIDDDADGLRYVIALPRLIAIGKTDYASRLIEQYVVRPLQGRSLETEITFRG
ncbi:MAG: AAA family ATPase, partial [Candidatus Kapaibacterium sp.]